jgi:hypothetical protein
MIIIFCGHEFQTVEIHVDSLIILSNLRSAASSFRGVSLRMTVTVEEHFFRERENRYQCHQIISKSLNCLLLDLQHEVAMEKMPGGSTFVQRTLSKELVQEAGNGKGDEIPMRGPEQIQILNKKPKDTVYKYKADTEEVPASGDMGVKRLSGLIYDEVLFSSKFLKIISKRIKFFEILLLHLQIFMFCHFKK